jgi:hypothetical protein
LRRKLNTILARKDILLIDGHEEEVFAYPTIPLTAFPDEAHPQLKARYEEFPNAWRQLRTKAIQSAQLRTEVIQNERGKQEDEPFQMRRVNIHGRKGNASATQASASAPQAASRSDATILAQLQAFEPMAGESETSSRARLDKIFEGVDDATMNRLLIQSNRFKQQSEMIMANSMMHSQAMIARASESAFHTQDLGNFGGDHWERKWVRK